MLGEKVALKYAQALFEVGKDENAIELFRTWLKNLEMIFEENSELREFILTPHVPRQAKKEVFLEICTGAPVSIQNFLGLLVDKRRENLIPILSIAYQHIMDENAKAMEVAVTSAFRLGANEEQSLIARLQELTGKTVRLKTNIEPSLIGGLILQIGNRRIDGSVVGQLRSMGASLIKINPNQVEVKD